MPLLASFGASATELTEGQLLRITAVLADTSLSMASSVRGVLADPTGTIIYNTFSQNMPGTFTIELTWAQLHQMKQLAFAKEEVRSFRADFIDSNGLTVSRNFSVRLHCNGNPACEGRCVVQGAACPVTTQQQCYGGRCASSGCVISGAGYISGELNPDSSCQFCQPLVTKNSWSSLDPYTSCAAGLTCSYGGKCEVPFTKIDSAQTYPSVTLVAAPDAATRYAYDLSNRSLYRRVNGTKVADATVATNLLAMQAPSASVVFLLNSSTLYRSTDSGAAFVNLIPSVGTLSTMWAASTQELFLGSSAGNVYRSTNQGNTFVAVAKLPNGSSATSIWGRSPASIYFGTGSGLFRTLDSGATYTQLRNFTSTNIITGIWGTGTSELYVTTRDAIWHTTDDGITWSRLTAPANAGTQTPNFISIHGCGANDVYFVNAGASPAELWHTADGKTTQLVPVGSEFGFGGARSVACTGPGKAFLGGSFDVNVGLLESP